VQANSSWTIPSVASFFTARPVLDLTSPAGEMVGVPDGLPTWATILRDAGFEGGAVVANYTVHALNGFAAGFSSYLVPDGRGEGEAPDGQRVVLRARAWLDDHRGEDAFLYLHLMDPHEPYRDHTGEGRRGPELQPLARGERPVTDAERDLLRELYAGEVRHVDRLLAEFLGELPEHAVVVFTSDHGEGLGEHGAWAHGLELHQETLSVPLMVAGPTVGSGERLEPVQLLDLGPTILDLAGVAADPSMVGRSLLAGGSGEPIVSATFGAGPLRWAWRSGDTKVVLRMAHQPGVGVQSRTMLIETDPPPAGGVAIDLAADPAEDSPAPVPSELAPEVGSVFAHTAGRMIPGMQLLLWGGDGFTTQTLSVDDGIEVVQAWSSGGVAVSHDRGVLTVTCADASLLCAVAAAAESVPATVVPMGERHEWANVESSLPIDPREVGPPDRVGRGWHLWWNPDRPLVVGGFDETVERLKALGYIE
jgi:arylsulfatase A-like enzyme